VIQTQLSASDILEQFESIGLNCEFGLVQRAFGIEQLGLLKWCVSEPEMLIEALQRRFDGIGEEGNVEIGRHGWEYDIIDKAYGFRGHSFVPVESIEISEFKKNTENRLNLLKRKLIEDLEDGQKIFVYKQNGQPFPDETMFRIANLIWEFGGSTLFWVCDHKITGKPAGTVDQLSKNLIRGHITRLAPYDDAHSIDLEGWIDLCRKAFELREKMINKTENLKKTAVILIVKNEKSTIGHWIDWHKNIGFDSIIIFDDNSDDGTKEILDQLHLDNIICLESLVGDHNDWYYERQQRCYRKGIEKYRESHEWLAFFDADEYLFLENDAKIDEFLSKFEEAHAVAINWCNYGSSGHVLKSKNSPVEDYSWHSQTTRHVNRHVKTILRPQFLGDKWHNVHSFDIDPDRYFLEDGTIINWSSEIGIIDRDPLWKNAKLMHFQCRSMEDFVERVKKRPEINATVALWTATDFHDIEDRRPVCQARKLRLDRLNLKANEVKQIAAYKRCNESEIDMLNIDEEKMSLTLDQIGLLTGTDKSSRHHGYLDFYDSFLSGIREKAITLLEIGVDKGASINMWANYFGLATITGVDINPSALAQQSPRITVEIGDQSDKVFLQQMAARRGPFDVIIDDGSHIWDHQIISLHTLFGSVKRGGFYIIEDLQTSFEYHDSYDHFKAGRSQSAVDYLLHVTNMLVARHIPATNDPFLEQYRDEIEYIAFQYGAALIKKRQ
jgi:glycosyltransferase involved in cell wall biosynthesis